MIMPRRKAFPKSLGTASNKASEKSSRTSSSIAPQKHSERLKKKLEVLPRKISKKSSDKSSSEKFQMQLEPSSVSSKNKVENTSKTIVLASQKNSKAVVRQSAYCMICKRSFTSKKKLNHHNAKHHFLRHCPNCPKTFQQTRKFILHLRSHLNDHPYVCKICLESFNQKKDMLAHKKTHKNPRRIVCDTCSEVFPHLNSFNRHRLMHKGPPYPCYVCSAVFSKVPDRTVHSKNHVHRCNMCPNEVIAFSKPAELASHVYEVHQDNDYVPSTSEVLNVFEPLVSTGAVNLDEDCGSDSMEELSSDSGESDADLDDNYKSDAVEPVYNLKRKDKFICFICYDLYPSSKLLKSHMMAHDWFPCNSCPEFFAFPETLAQHRCIVRVSSFICKSCNGENKCKNCKRSYNSEVNENALQTIGELPKVPTDYSDAEQRNLLYSFIERVKSQKEPLDIVSFNLVGLHTMSLRETLKNPNVRCLFEAEHIPHIEDLYVKFKDLGQILCFRMK